MTQANIKSQLAEGEFDAPGATPVRFLNVGTPATPAYLLAYGTSVPGDGAINYATGALFIHTDGSAGTAVYRNEGDRTSSDFDAIVDLSSEFALADGKILVGSAAGKAAAVTMSGDATIANTGAVTIATGAVEDSMIEGLADGQMVVGTDGTAANNAKATISAILGADLSAAVVDVAADSVVIVDATDSGGKLESVADLATGIAGDGLAATSGVVALDVNGLTTAATEAAQMNDKIAMSDTSDSTTTKSMTPQKLFDGLTNLSAAVAATGDKVVLSDATNSGIAVNETIDDLFGIGPALTAAGTIDVSADHFLFLDGGATGACKKEAVADLVTAMAGTVGNSGLSASSGVLEVEVHSVTDATIATTDKLLFADESETGDPTRTETIDDLFGIGPALTTEATVAVAADYLLFLDGGASGACKKEAIADLVTAMAGTAASSGLAATNGVLALVPASLTAEVIATGDSLICADATASSAPKSETIDDLFSIGPALTTAAAVDVSADHFLFLDGGASGAAKKEAVADLVTAVAGTAASTGLAATSGVLALVPASLTAATVAGTDSIILGDASDSNAPKAESAADLAAFVETNQALASRPARSAFGYVYLSAQGNDADLITIDGRTYEFDPGDDGITGDVEIDTVGNVSIDEDIADIVTAINGDGSAVVTAVADTGNDVVWLYADTTGTAGNSITLAESTSEARMKVSGATLADGAEAAVLAVVTYEHTVTTNEALLGALRFDSGLTSIEQYILTYDDGGTEILSSDDLDVTVAISGGVVTLGEGAAPAWAASDVIRLTVIGTE